MTDQEKRIEDLEEQLKKSKQDVSVWENIHMESIRGLLCLHGREDILSLSGVKVGDYLGDSVPYILKEYDRMKLKETNVQPHDQ